MNLLPALDGAFCVRLVTTLAHFLWQAATAAVVAGVLARMLGRGPAQSRYAVYVLALLLMAGAPVATFVFLAPDRPVPAALPAPNVEPPVTPIPEPRRVLAELPPQPAPTPVTQPVESRRVDRTSWTRVAPHLTAAYFVGVTLMMLRLAMGLWGGGRLRRVSAPVEDGALLAALARTARSVGLRFTPAIAFCRNVAVPTVIGVLRPMVLLPMTFATGLTPEQVEAVLVHELAHIRRCDYLVNLVQRLIESALFFHPAVWWVSRRIRLEREHCCDDVVLATGSDPRVYAESLVTLAERRIHFDRIVRLAQVAALGASADKPSNLRRRVLRLLGRTCDEPLRLARTWPVVLLLLGAALLAASLVVRTCAAPTTTGKPPDPPVGELVRATGQHQLIADADLIFVGKVVKVDWASGEAATPPKFVSHFFKDWGVAHVECERTIRGARNRQVVLLTVFRRNYYVSGEDSVDGLLYCRLDIQPGGRWLVFAKSRPEEIASLPAEANKHPRLLAAARLETGKEAIVDQAVQAEAISRLRPNEQFAPLAKLLAGGALKSGDLLSGYAPEQIRLTGVSPDGIARALNAGLSRATLGDDMRRYLLFEFDEFWRQHFLNGKHDPDLLRTLQRMLLDQAPAMTSTGDELAEAYVGTLLYVFHTDDKFPYRIPDKLAAGPSGDPARVAEALRKLAARLKPGETALRELLAKAQEVGRSGLQSQIDRLVELQTNLTRLAAQLNLYGLERVNAGMKLAASGEGAPFPVLDAAGEKTETAKPAALEFRIVPNGVGSNRLPAMTPFAKDLIDDLAKTGPESGRARGDEFQWFELGDGVKDLPNTAEYQGRTYVLLCGKAPYVMRPNADGPDQWGLRNVGVAKDEAGRPVISFEFDEPGKRLFGELTKGNIDNRLAVVVKGKVVSAPVVKTAIGGYGIITGNFTDAEAEALAAELKAALPPVVKPTVPVTAGTCRVTGTLVTESGRAVPKGNVSLQRVGQADGKDVSYSAETDDKGAFAFDKVVPGAYTLRATGPDLNVAGGMYRREDRLMDVDVSAGQAEQQVRVRLLPWRTKVRVTLLDPEGKPVRDAVTYVCSFARYYSMGSSPVKTDLGGVFDISCYPQQSRTLNLVVPERRLWARFTFKPGEDEKTLALTAKCTLGGTLSGRVVEKGTGRGAGAIQVYPDVPGFPADSGYPSIDVLAADGAEYSNFTRDGDGAFRIVLPAGDYVLRSEDLRQQPVDSIGGDLPPVQLEGEVRFTIRPGETTDKVDLRVEPFRQATLRGRVVDAQGKPVPRQLVYLSENDRMSFYDFSRRVVTDGEGRFAIYPLPPREYDLRVAKPNEPPGPAVAVDLKAGGESAELEFQLPAQKSAPADRNVVPKADPPGTWGEPVDGFRARIAPAAATFDQYAPVTLTLEIQNVEQRARPFDDQALIKMFGGIRPDGKPLRYVHTPYQTMSMNVPKLAYQETKKFTLVLSGEWDTSMPGEYRLQFRDPASNVATFTVTRHDPAKPLPPVADALPEGLLDAVESVLPDGWYLWGATSYQGMQAGLNGRRVVELRYNKPLNTDDILRMGGDRLNYSIVLYDLRSPGLDDVPRKNPKLRLLGETPWFRVFAEGSPHPDLGWKDPDGDVRKVLKLTSPAGAQVPAGRTFEGAFELDKDIPADAKKQVEQAAKAFMTAVREKDLARVQDLIVETDLKWKKTRMEQVLREINYEYRRDPAAMTQFDSTVVKGDVAAVGVALPAPEREAGGPYLYLILKRTEAGWRVAWMDAAAQGKPLEKPLDDFAVREAAKAFMSAVRDRELEAVKKWAVEYEPAPGEPDSVMKRWNAAQWPKMIRELRDKVYVKDPERLVDIRETLVEGDFAAVRIAAPTEQEKKSFFLVLQRLGAGWRVRWSDDIDANEALKGYLDRLIPVFQKPRAAGDLNRSITVDYSVWLTSVRLKDGTLTYVWHTVKPGKEPSANPANYDAHTLTRALSDKELGRFGGWIDARRVFSLPKKFGKEDSAQYAVTMGSGLVVTRGADRYEKTLDGRGEIPPEFTDALKSLENLCREIRDGVRWEIPPELREKRDKLLAQADATIRKGLVDLGEKYPHMKKARQDWDALSRPSTPGGIGTISIWFHYTDQGKPGPEPIGTVPEKERFGVQVNIRPPREEEGQLATFPLYPNLGLVGWVGTSAGDPELAAALKKLVDDALKPLADLEAAAADVNRNIAWGKEVAGLQLGLALGGGERPCRRGETVRFAVYARNTGDRRITLVHYGMLGRAPTLLDANGRKIPVNIPVIDMPVQKIVLELAPGEQKLVGTMTLKLDENNNAGAGADGPYVLSVFLAPGAYRANLTWRFEKHAEATWSGEVTTGELTLTVAGDAATEKAAEAAWGKEVGGLQLGLAYVGESRTFRGGERVIFRLSLRNVGNKAQTVADPTPNPDGSPRMNNADGKSVMLAITSFSTPRRRRKLTLDPGATGEVGTMSLRLASAPGGRGVDGFLKPGVYRVSEFCRFEPDPETTWSGELTTGELTLTVAAPDGAAEKAAAELLGLEAPVTVKTVSYFSDGGTTGILLIDAQGKEYPFCLDGRERGEPLPRHIFTGAGYPTGPGAKMEPIGGDVERTLRTLLQAWVDGKADAAKQAALLEKGSIVGLSDADIDLLRVLRVCRTLTAREAAATIPWGEAVEGVAVRLRPDKVQWKAGEAPTFKAAFRNNGKRELGLVLAPGSWEVEVDGVWYHATVMININGRVDVRPLGPGVTQMEVPISLDAHWGWKATAGNAPLEFTPGRHTIRMVFTALPEGKDAGKPIRAVSNPVEIEILPLDAKPADTRSRPWVTILPKSPIRSLSEYHHALRTDPPGEPPLYKPAPVPVSDIEIRRAADGSRVARVPYAGYFRDHQELREADLRRIGELPDGKYLAALCTGNDRCSNVMTLEIDPKYDPKQEPALRLVPLPLAPGQTLPYVGFIATGRDPIDPELTNMAATFPTLVVDGIERKLEGTTWAGPVGPLQPRQRHQIILDLGRYKPEIARGVQHKVKARVLKYESAEVMIPAKDDLGIAWDKATPGLEELKPPAPLVRGTVTGWDGKPGAGYELVLSSQDRHYNEKCTGDGRYELFNVPAGEYQLFTTRPGYGRGLTVMKVVVEPGKTVTFDLSLESRFRFSGRVTYNDGGPAAGQTVEGTWKSPDGNSEFNDIARTDAEGRYALGAPFEVASLVYVLPGEPRQQNVRGGREDVNFTLWRAWGGENDGLQIGAGKPEAAGTSATLDVVVRNTRTHGAYLFRQAEFQLEVHGKPYVHRDWTAVTAKPESVEPGRMLEPIRLSLADYVAEADRDNSQTAPRPLTKLLAGKHNIRVVLVATPRDGGIPVRAQSNPVEIEILAEAEKATGKPPGANELEANLAAAKARVEAEQARLAALRQRVEAGRTTQDDLKEQELKLLDAQGRLVELTEGVDSKTAAEARLALAKAQVTAAEARLATLREQVKVGRARPDDLKEQELKLLDAQGRLVELTEGVDAKAASEARLTLAKARVTAAEARLATLRKLVEVGKATPDELKEQEVRILEAKARLAELDQRKDVEAAPWGEAVDGLQVLLTTVSPRRTEFEQNEPVPGVVAFRYFKPTGLPGDSAKARGKTLTICAEGPGGVQRKEVAIDQPGGLLPTMGAWRSGAEGFEGNLGQILSLSKPGMYRVWVAHEVKPGADKKAWSGSVRSAQLEIEIKPRPEGLTWGEAVGGLRGCIQPKVEDGKLTVEVRLENVGKKKLVILPFDEGEFNWERTYGAALNFQLLDAKGTVTERETLDATSNLKRLKFLAEMIQPGAQGFVLEPKELYNTVVTVETGKREHKFLHGLEKARMDGKERISAVYNTTRHASLAEKIIQEPVWGAELTMPAAPLAAPKAEAKREEAPWGEAVEGVRVRLRPDKVQLKAGETPIFKIDLRSEEARSFPSSPAGPDQEFEILVDGGEYRYAGPDFRNVVDRTRVERRDDIHLALLSKMWLNKKDGKALELTPGKHTVHIAFTAQPTEKDGGKPIRAVSNPVEIEILPVDAKPADTRPPTWVTILPKSPIRSLSEYHHALRTDPPGEPPLYKPAPVPVSDIEIRRAADGSRVARIPYAGYLRDHQELRGPDLRRIGELPAGKYLVALCVGDQCCSNVAEFEIDPAYDPVKERPLRVAALETVPGRNVVHLGVRGTGPTPEDPKFETLAVHFPELIVDGTKRQLKGTAGSSFALRPGAQFDSIVDLGQYDPPITFDKPHTVKAAFGRYESNTVDLRIQRPLGNEWDQATAKLPPVPPPTVLLRGKVTGPDGKPANGYEVALTAPGGNYREKSAEGGRYEFPNVPPGEYGLSANPPGKGQPQVGLRKIALEAEKTVERDLTLERKFLLVGRVTQEDGKPAANLAVDISAAEQDAEFMDTTTTDADGRYELGTPFGRLSYVGVGGGRVDGAMPELKPGKNTADWVLRKDGNRFRGFPAKDAAWGEAVEGVRVRLRADKQQWKVGEWPKLTVDLINRGNRELRIRLTHWPEGDVLYPMDTQVQLDGVWYGMTVFRGPEVVKPFGPGSEYSDILAPLHRGYGWQSKGENKPLEFSPGKHSVRLALIAHPQGNPEDVDRLGRIPSVRAVSNAVEIEILESAPVEIRAEDIPPLTPEERQRAESLIQQFSAREFAVRQQAVEKLVEMGPAVLPMTRKTLAETKDNEVKLRCEMVIKGIAQKPRIDSKAPPGAVEPARGEAVEGLAVRLECAKTEVPMGSKVNFSLEFRFDAEGAGAHVDILPIFRPRVFDVKVTLRDTKTRKTYERSTFHIIGGPPRIPGPKDLVMLRGGPIPTQVLEVYLLAWREGEDEKEPEQIPEGTYEVSVTCTVDANKAPVGWPGGDTKKAPVAAWPGVDTRRFWAGTVVSPPIQLTVTHAEPKEVEIKYPAALVISVEKGKLVSRWSDEGWKTVRLKVRPGHELATRGYRFVTVNGKERPVLSYSTGGISWLAAGNFGDPGDVGFTNEDVNLALAGQKVEARVKMEVVEFAPPAGGFGYPGAVLWTVEAKGKFAPEDAAKLTRQVVYDWGDAVGGLQTQLTLREGAPEDTEVFLNVRNVSDKPIEVGRLPFPIRHLKVLRDGKFEVPARDRTMTDFEKKFDTVGGRGILKPGSWTQYAMSDLAREYDLTTAGTYTFQWVGAPEGAAVQGRVPPPSNVAMILVEPNGHMQQIPLPIAGAPDHKAGAEAPWGEAVEGIQGRVWLTESRYRLRAPIRIRLALKNISDRPLHVPRDIGFFDIVDHLFYENQDHSDDIKGGERSAKAQEDFVVLQPGATYEFPLDRENMVLSPKRCQKPGRYRYSFEASFHRPLRTGGSNFWAGGIKTNSVEFEIVADAGRPSETEHKTPSAVPAREGGEAESDRREAKEHEASLLRVPEGVEPKTASMARMRKLGVALIAYAHDHEGRFPDSWGELLKEVYLVYPAALVCPVSGNTVPDDFPKDPKKAELAALKRADEFSDYVLIKGVSQTKAGDLILAHEKRPFVDEGRCCLFVDGHVEWLAEADFQKRIKTQQPPWGEAVEAVQVRLRAEKVQWKAGGILSFRIDVRNTGGRELSLGGFPLWDSGHVEFYADGQAYRATKINPQLNDRPFLWLPPGRLHEGLNFNLDEKEAWRGTAGGRLLELKPGKHTILFSFVVFTEPLDKEENRLARVFTNAVEIEILPAGAAAGTEEQEIDAFLARLEKSWPKNWHVEARTDGKVAPVGWPEGEGTYLVLSCKGAKVVPDGTREGGELHLWIMKPPYDSGPPAQTNYARELAAWDGRRVFARGSVVRDANRPGAVWPGWGGDLLTAMYEAKESAWGKETAGLKARVSLRKRQYVAGETIQARLEVRNVSDQSIRMPGEIRFFYSNTNLAFEGETPTGLIGQGAAPADKDMVVLKPGEVHVFPHFPEGLELGRHPNRLGRYAFSYSLAYYPREKDRWSGLLTSNTILFDVVAPTPAPAWGEAVQGVQVRLRAQQEKWLRDEAPAFSLDMRISGEATTKFVGTVVGFLEIEYDGEWFQGHPTGRRAVFSGLERDREALSVLPVNLNERWVRKKGGEPLKLSPGRHRVRVALYAQLDREKADERMRVLSNAVEIEILPAGAGATSPAGVPAASPSRRP